MAVEKHDEGTAAIHERAAHALKKQLCRADHVDPACDGRMLSAEVCAAFVQRSAKGRVILRTPPPFFIVCGIVVASHHSRLPLFLFTQHEVFIFTPYTNATLRSAVFRRFCPAAVLAL